MTNIELGLDTFGDVTVDAEGRPQSHAQVLRDVIAEAELADRVGVDFFGVGEHHRPDFAISAPEVLLAAIAGRTKRLRLGTAVTVLSSDDPIRVYQRFTTLDAVSNGRAEVILGRGSFTESFPLFGYSLDDYDVLFEEKLAIFAALRDADRTGQPVRWKGTVRPPLDGVRVYPAGRASAAQHLGGSRRQPGVGGPRGPLRLSADARHHRRRPAPLQALRRALPPRARPARAWSRSRSASTRRGTSPKPTPRRARSCGRPTRSCGIGSVPSADGPRPAGPSSTSEIAEGSLYVGSPETVARKIAATVRALGASRFDLKYSAGTLRHELMLRSIELYGREVIPRVRELVSDAPVRAEGKVAASVG